MKRIHYFLLTLVCLFTSSMAMADDVPIPVEKLPTEAKTFIKAHFADKSVLLATKDWDSYECHLDDGTKIDFNKKGVWQKVDCLMNAVPAALVPAQIAKYVTATFPNCTIIKIEKERYGWDIELSNDMELKFNKQGVLIGMDD